MKLGIRVAMLLAVVGFIVAAPLPPASADIKGPHRITLMNGNRVEGDVTETKDGYEVRTKHGAIVTIKRSAVREITPLAGAPAAQPGKGAAPDRPTEVEVSDAEIADILGELASDSEDPIATLSTEEALPINRDSVDQMLRLAGKRADGSAAATLETDHFALVYTSSDELARKLASRLESVYRWVGKFMDMLGVPQTPPENKLEIFFFGTHAEYKGYGSTVGGIPDWAAGFYMHTNNRSAFYDMNTEPRVAELLTQLKQPGVDWRQRQFINNRVKRFNDFFNLTVIQHEAAHHIHFNMGVFPRRGDMPTWLVEGLAQMFEMPPGRLGGSLGATNHYRLAEFNSRWRTAQSAIPDLQLFLSDDRQWDPQQHYPLGWALTHYLWKKHRDGFAKYMQKLAQREDDTEVSQTQRQQEFEDIFGEVNQKWREDFIKYILDTPWRRSALDL